ncbi:putative copper radical oxidase [Lyophyllum shimeji]|uniref:Copper radical oxidase n=1 Tax=Lyophyllum shimeji TaxID=47721 RepID=A0A9P3UR72_LYOSH|nr:putative copper radical oxidase [Lyophyllum shimeji]
MQLTLKNVVLGALFATGAAAVDLQYCHGGATDPGVCEGITLTTPDTTCYDVDATIGTIDTVVGLTAGLQYALFTGAICTGNASDLFGTGANSLVPPFLDNVLSIAAGIPPLPSAWTPLGCFTDANAGSRALEAATFINSTMTIEKCQDFCDASGFGFAGVEFGSECYCDFSIQFPSVETDATACNVPCGGNANETCGGPSVINIFTNGKPQPTVPAEVVGPNTTSWLYQGCLTDNSIGTRTFPLHLAPETGGVTPQTCVDTCFAAGQIFAGVEFGSECWCGNAANANATTVDDVQCGQACTADPTFFCGDANRLNVWKQTVESA